MGKVITDEKLIDELLTRGVENIFPSREGLKKVLLSGKRLKLYCGYDPTAKSLHIGNAISINKLGQFQRLGHEVIFLIGDFTGMIGDPTDKSATRKKLTRKEALENSKNYQKQASGYLKFDGENSAVLKHNSDWSDKLTFKDLIEIASNFTLQQMINRDMFKRNLAIVKCRHCNFEWPSPIQFGTMETFKSSNLKGNTTNCPNCGKITGLDKEDMVIKKIDQLRETPIGFHELLYPLAQGYDSVAMDVDLEVGGNDQMFNMLAGRDLMKAVKGKEKFVLTIKLLADENGKKMGKTEGNVVNLDETPENMFGQIMAWSDGLINPGFELCTNLPLDLVAEIKEKIKDSQNNPRDFKLQLAYEIAKINHGEEAAQKAKEYFINTFSKKEIPKEVREHKVEWCEPLDSYQNIQDFIVSAGLAKSKSDARRKIEQGGVYIDGERTVDARILTKDDEGKIIKVGKKDFIKVKF